jgi:uncharacterized membrane protein
MFSRLSDPINRIALKVLPYAGLADRFREALGGFPEWLVVTLIAMLPIFELRGAIPAGVALGMPVWKASLFAVIGNMIPIAFILWFLDPFSSWLSRHSRTMDRFFTWLFARTRRKHSKDFERWQEFALMIFVAIPLPMTGAWSGAVAAFVFDIPKPTALLFIFFGVLIACGVVALATSFSFLLGWQGSLIFFALLTVALVYIFMRGKKEYAAETARLESEEASPASVIEEDPEA